MARVVIPINGEGCNSNGEGLIILGRGEFEYMESETSPDENPVLEALPCISKNQLKKQLKLQRKVEQRKDKRQLERQKKKEKRLLLRQPLEPTIESDTVDLNAVVSTSNPETHVLSGVRAREGLQSDSAVTEKLSRVELKEKLSREREELCRKNCAIIIDCDWEHVHAEGPLTSLCQQLLFLYGTNNHSPTPCSVFLTGVGPRLLPKLEKCNVSRWQSITCSRSAYTYPLHEGRPVVYLTSDAEETLMDIDPLAAYIIGGIVDRNAHKFATLNKAKEQGIRTAKLPIKEHCELTASAVLTVNQIFAILLKFTETKSWSTAISSVTPSRKRKVVSEANNCLKSNS